MSSRGQLCLIQQDMLSACTANLLDRNLNYEAIDRGAVAESAIGTENAGASSQFVEADGLSINELQQI